MSAQEIMLNFCNLGHSITVMLICWAKPQREMLHVHTLHSFKTSSANMMHVCCLSDGANKDTSSESKSKQHHVFTVLADMFWFCDTGSRRAPLQKVNTSPPHFTIKQSFLSYVYFFPLSFYKSYLTSLYFYCFFKAEKFNLNICYHHVLESEKACHFHYGNMK